MLKIKPSQQLIKLIVFLLSLFFIICPNANCQETKQNKKEDVFLYFYLTDIDMENDAPSSFFTRFTLGLEQSAKSKRILKLNEIEFYDNQGLEKLGEESTLTKNNKLYNFAIYQGQFRTFKNYRDYPFDSHTLIIAFHFPDAIDTEKNLNIMPGKNGLISLDISGETFEEWNIKNISLVDSKVGYLQGFPDFANDDQELQAIYNRKVFAVAITISRDPSGGIIFVFGPMLILWALAYIGLYWKQDSSPSSRYGSTAMLSAITLSFAIRSIKPHINYLTLDAAGFLLLYINILISIIFVTIAFALYRRKQLEASQKILNIGRISMPFILIASIGYLCLSIQSTQHTYQDVFNFDHVTKMNCNQQSLNYLQCKLERK